MNPELVVSIVTLLCSSVSVAYTMYCNNVRSDEWNHMFEWMKIQEKINKEHIEKIEEIGRSIDQLRVYCERKSFEDEDPWFNKFGPWNN